MREISEIICNCGGKPLAVDTTEEERKKYGCHRDSKDYTCCVSAFLCQKCKTRWTFSFEAPEYD